MILTDPPHRTSDEDKFVWVTLALEDGDKESRHRQIVVDSRKGRGDCCRMSKEYLASSTC